MKPHHHPPLATAGPLPDMSKNSNIVININVHFRFRMVASRCRFSLLS
ncbi:MAG: hypothetical protein ACYDET_06735 [Thermoleophilia bacterium]